MKGKVVIVTGANTGIGRATAAQLASMGATVVMACRSLERGGAAAEQIRNEVVNANVDVMHLDLADWESVKKFAREFGEKYQKLHVLINNAGIINSTFSKTKYGVETVMLVNHIGPVLLTLQLREYLEKVGKEEGPPRIVMVASEAHTFAGGKITKEKLDFDPAREGSSLGMSETMTQYGLTKLCNILFTRHYAALLAKENSPIFIFAVHPGWVETELGRDDKGPIIRTIESLVAKTPELGARPSVYCACDPDLVSDGTLSGGYYVGVREKGKLPSYCTDQQDAQMLWDWTNAVLTSQQE